MRCGSGDNLLIKVDDPIERDVGGIDVQIIGLCSRVRGNHRRRPAVGNITYLLSRLSMLMIDYVVGQTLEVCAEILSQGRCRS